MKWKARHCESGRLEKHEVFPFKPCCRLARPKHRQAERLPVYGLVLALDQSAKA